jgi:hypothetical protein
MKRKVSTFLCNLDVGSSVNHLNIILEAKGDAGAKSIALTRLVNTFAVKNHCAIIEEFFSIHNHLDVPFQRRLCEIVDEVVQCNCCGNQNDIDTSDIVIDAFHMLQRHTSEIIQMELDDGCVVRNQAPP